MKKVLSLICILLANTFAQAQEQNWFSDFHICETKDTTIVFPTSVISDSTFTWLFNNDPISYNFDNSITIDSTGVYTLEIINIGEDTLTDNFTVTVDLEQYDFVVSLNTEQSLDSVITMCLEDSPILGTTQSDYTHFWYLDGYLLHDSLSENTLVVADILDEIEFDQEHFYTAEIENACGIVLAKNEVTLIVNECHCALNMPNVFTPNGDEFNNTFKPYNDHEDQVEAENICESTDFSMEVFSQWGRHMATVNSGNEYPSWDGLNKSGNEVAEGVYFYRIVYKVNIYTLPKQKEISGFVHLYRD
ncbi:MAG: gliding motility-associated C-terminal domain-containing protein [Flavobacteriales bacterium]|jgi:gliding motility-associated-like protein|tara:strand:- start:106 stop:1017 length:912 start_codon:yes stop_codon:yes gene_type:complete